MMEIGKYKFDMPLILAPMEDISDVSFRRICKELGADIVFTEFINAEGLTRGSKKTYQKMCFEEDERPVIVQIYGEKIESMVNAAKMAEELNPEMIDINAGCWVKKISGRGAGAGLIRNPEYLEEMVKAVADSVSVPVSVKTRIGWDQTCINILENAERIQRAGAKMLTLHCRTRSQGHSGDADWEWINKVKEVVDIPVILNGGIFTVEDVKKAIETTNCDGIMIARGAIGQPWLFKNAKAFLENGTINELSTDDKFNVLYRHLELTVQYKGDRGLIEFRKYYTGYLKGMHNASKVRNEIMRHTDFGNIMTLLQNFQKELKEHEEQGLNDNNNPL